MTFLVRPSRQVRGFRVDACGRYPRRSCTEIRGHLFDDLAPKDQVRG